MINIFNSIGKAVKSAFEKGVQSRSISSPTTTSNDCPYFMLKVPYNTQRDNQKEPSGACNVTCLWMLLHNLCDKLGIRDDDIMKYIESNEAIEYAEEQWGNERWVRSFIEKRELEHLWAMLEWMGNMLIQYFTMGGAYKPSMYQIVEKGTEPKKEISFKYRTLEAIVDKISIGKPVIIGGKFTRSGHFVIAVGHLIVDKDRYLIVHDPWGDATASYKSHNGRSRLYSFEYLMQVLHHDNQTTKEGIPMFRTITFE